MKNYRFLLFILLTTLVFAQDNDRSEYQKLLFEDAKKIAGNGDYIEAIRTFAIANNINPKAEIADIAIKKSDSLKSILRKNKINSLIGEWKWIYKDGNWAIREDGLGGKMIKITTDEILFFELYRKSKKWELVKTEKIKFSENPESYSFTEILYANNDVWDYSIDNDSGELKAYYIGEKMENGNYSEMVCGNPVEYYFKLQ